NQRTPRTVRLIALFGMAVTLVVGARLAYADDPSAAFTWDVRHERTLFAEEPKVVVAAKTLAASPTLAIDHLYQLQLREQSEVTFVAPPERKANDATYAGLARLTIETASVYRISLDQPLWIDVFVNGAVVPAKDFQGRPSCNAPHKIVEFALPAGTPV